MSSGEGGAGRHAAGFHAPPVLRLVPLQPEALEPAEVAWLAGELAERLGTRVEVARTSSSTYRTVAQRRPMASRPPSPPCSMPSTTNGPFT